MFSMDPAPIRSFNHLVTMGNEWPQMALSLQTDYPTDAPSSSAASSAEATAGNEGSSFLSRFTDDSLEGHTKHWIRVGNLSGATTDAELKKLFYPYGGDEAFVMWELDGCVVGFVGFELAEMAAIAAEKMDAFIPCRQTHALSVHRVGLEEVTAARSGVTTAPSKRPLSALLAAQASEASVAVALLGRLADPSAAAVEVAVEVGRAAPTTLRGLLTALLAVSGEGLSGSVAVFFDELLKELLRRLLDTREQPHGSPLAPHAVVNCGAALGNLFAMHIFPGDPFVFASRLLQRTGAVDVAQVNGICAVAHACHAMPFPISKASFWALVGHSASEATSPQLRETLLTHLRQLKVTPAAPPQPQTFSTQPPTADATPPKAQSPSALSGAAAAVAAGAPRSPAAGDARLRTVHISHLPPQLAQRDLMEILLRAGLVNKVRLCIGNGYTTLFAFVEMQTVEGARAVTRMLNNVTMMGLCLRVQAARNPVQDVTSEDAAYSRSGAMLSVCTFGTSTAPLMACASSVQGTGRA